MAALDWIFGVFLIFLSFQSGSSECGYESCNKEKPGFINVHIVPHTHDDVGWLWTVDQYYYRSVQYILDTVVRELVADPQKRFIYVEIAFFSRWFAEQNDGMRHTVTKLVNEGRLEFILGGWCMNDEAATHYSAIIDQHKLGFEFLRETFGECARPKIGWQIDPFGHSREHASIFAQFGFDGLFLGRLDFQDKKQRMENNTMEMVWRGSPRSIEMNEIIQNHVASRKEKVTSLISGLSSLVFGDCSTPTPNGQYQMTNSLCEISVANLMDTTIDDPKLHDNNIKKMVDLFVKDMFVQASWYGTNHLIVTMGEDFNYQDAHMYFKELDKLVKYVNARQATGSKINVLYSTPSCYLKALNEDNRTWSTKEDDFFPYTDRPHTFWTGYFTSRPTFKYYARYVNSFFQAVKQMDSLAKLDNTHDSRTHLHRLGYISLDSVVFISRFPFMSSAEVLGVAQHHDAVSGTAKQAVDYDYSERLTEGMNKAETVVWDVYNTILPKSDNAPFVDQEFCHYLNVSICNTTQLHDQFQVTVYNPLSWSVRHVLRLPVSGSKYTVLGPDAATNLPNDVIPVSTSTHNLPDLPDIPAKNELVFEVTLPPVGLSTFFVINSETKSDSSLKFSSENNFRDNGRTGSTLSGKMVQVDFTPDGRLKSVTNKQSGLHYPVRQDYYYYKGFVGNNEVDILQASGAYIFRPAIETPTQIEFSTWSGVYKGQVVQEAHQQFGDFVSQVVRVYEDKPYVEVEWTVGPIPIHDEEGKEVVTRYNIGGVSNDGVFYTDSNGREVLERRLNYRPTWKLVQSEPIAGNYYPVNALFSIKDESKGVQFTVLTDRSQGGTSLNDGDVELMLHRRLLVDDGKGVGEPLNETGLSGKGLIARGKHYLLLTPIKEAAPTYRKLAKEVFLTPQPSFSALAMDPKTWYTTFNTSWSGLQVPLPPNVHLLSLEQFQHTGPVPSPDGSIPYLVRLEHFYEAGDDPDLSRPVAFDILDLFKPFVLKDVHELTLGANIPIEKSQRLFWRTFQNPSGDVNLKRRLNGTVVSLGPMDIVTLQANIKF